MPGGDHTGPLGNGPRTGKCRGTATAIHNAVTATENCICSACDYTAVHQRGVPCSQTTCPNCGAVLTRQRTATQGEGAE